MHLEFEGDNLYWREADYQAGNYKNAFWINGTDSLAQVKPVTGYSNRYVVIEGIFDAGPGGHGSLNPGTINGITGLNSLQRSAW